MKRAERAEGGLALFVPTTGSTCLLTLLTKEKKVPKSSNDIVTGFAVILEKEQPFVIKLAVSSTEWQNHSRVASTLCCEKNKDFLRGPGLHLPGLL